MFKTTVSRGRPKGTGIDDNDRIARLIELLRTNSNLKPTTAIRVMGITDPSAIRRIRDKYKSGLAGAASNAVAHMPAGAHRATGPIPAADPSVATRVQG